MPPMLLNPTFSFNNIQFVSHLQSFLRIHVLQAWLWGAYVKVYIYTHRGIWAQRSGVCVCVCVCLCLCLCVCVSVLMGLGKGARTKKRLTPQRKEDIHLVPPVYPMPTMMSGTKSTKQVFTKSSLMNAYRFISTCMPESIKLASLFQYVYLSFMVFVTA